MIIVEFSVLPTGVGESISSYVAKALKTLKEANVNYELTPMGTIFEAKTLREVFDVISKAHEAVVSAGAKRVLTNITIDDRRDKERKMDDKVKSVLNKLKNIEDN